MFLQQLLHTIPITEKTRHPPTITNIVAILISVFQYLALTIHPSVLRKKTAQTINDEKIYLYLISLTSITLIISEIKAINKASFQLLILN